ncbi:MAG TPA: hypothetical protein VMP67_09325 [Candidatus Limnocylindria bacterium]|nr:hypothetical protein [Candidatus Limnocylindria bacterium]
MPPALSRGKNLNVLDLVERLAITPPSGITEIEAALDLRLTPDSARTSPYYDWFEVELEGPVTRVTWRAPSGARSSAPTLLVLDVAPLRCIKQADVTARFGLDVADVSVPEAHAPADSPIYLVYRRSWGSLKFGFMRQPPSCLRSVVFQSGPEP